MEGYFDKRNSLASMMRIASYRIHQSLCGKDAISIEEYWPIEGEEKREKDIFVADADMIAKIKKRHKIK